jgi:RES domain-containing protein
MAEWKSILKPAVYKALETAVKEKNAGLTTDRGSAVSRGTDLDNWIGNYKYGHRNHKIY